MMLKGMLHPSGTELINPMAHKRSTPVKVPKSEVARQATDALGGYVYQLDHTVLTWLTLGEDEALHIEFAEDVTISKDGKLELTQIKKLSSNITLRSDGVAKLITSVWSFQKENPDRQVSGALLTTSGIGKERKMSFPGGLPGLVYWRTAARPGADVEPIRTALLSLDLPDDLKSFIKGATADKLRLRVIRPIHWLNEGANQDELRRDIEEKLVLLGARIGVPAEASKNARDFLIGALLDSLDQPAQQRYVTRADLLTLFQKKTFITLPPDILRRLPIATPGASLTPLEVIARDVAQIPLPRRAALRTREVERLQAHLVSSGILWFHGSNGLGKSTLSVLLARLQHVAWRFADLRELSASATRSVLTGVASSFRQTGAQGLILDDMPADADNALISAIAQVARAVADADGVLVITSTKPPQPTLRARLDLNGEAVIRVPYLTEADVADIVKNAGGNPQKWARSIHVFAGGHPQLVDARVAGLEQRGWNEKEIFADIAPLKDTPNDMEEERKAVRNRLLGELQPSAVELLLRLSLLYGNFDRSMALLAADTPPVVPQAGLVFDFLVGPWIEQLGPERYRLSPLLKDSGIAGLTPPLPQSIKTNVMNYLIEQQPFPADQLLQVFLIAFQQLNRKGLTWFGHAILSAAANPKMSQFRRLAQEVSVFALVDRGEDKPLVPGDPRLSTLLRFAQLRVAVATDDMKQAAKLVDRALAEKNFADAKRRRLHDAMVFATVMLEPRIPISPKRWLPMLLELVAMPTIPPLFEQPHATRGEFSGLPPTATPDEMMFIGRATTLTSVEELVELIEALEQQPKTVRDRYLSAAARTSQSLHLIVAASWLTAVKRPGFDAHAAATTYHRLTQTISAKNNPDLAVELLCAEAIMLDEYGNDKDGALEALRAAQEAYPNDYRLNRQRQKVFYRHGQHVKALSEFEKFRDQLPKDRAVDRAYAMREAGRSAAETGDLERARAFFEQAWESARVCGSSMKPMTAGLSADCAVLDFDAGRKESALQLMYRALLEADDLNPRAGLREAFVKRVHVAAILYMQGAAADYPAARQAMIYGICSNPEPQEWFRQQPQPQPAFVWYQLAQLEAEISRSQAVLTELRKRTQEGGGLLPLETILVIRLAAAAVRDLDVDRFLEALKTYPRAVVEGIRNMRGWGGGDPFNMPVGELAPLAENEWRIDNIAQTTKHAVLSFMLACTAAGRADVIGDLRHKVMLVRGLAEELDNLFRVMDEPSTEEKDVYVIIASIVGRVLSGEAFDTNDVFLSAIYVLQLLENSALALAAAEALMPFYERVWREILQERTFSMRGPATNGPIILAAMRRGETAMQRLANMVLATEAAANRSLSNHLREQFSRIAAKGPKPDAASEG
jgi:tetratricopeptide (TPR) repeat protein